MRIRPASVIGALLLTTCAVAAVPAQESPPPPPSHAAQTAPHLDSIAAADARFCATRTARSFQYLCATRRNVAAVRVLDHGVVARVDTVSRVDTVWRVDTVVVTRPRDTSVVVVPDTGQALPAPADAVFTHTVAPPPNGTQLADLPRDSVRTAYPVVLRQVRCTALQACLDTAKTGDELLTAPGSVHRNIIIRPTARTGAIAVRTDVALGGPWERMTPARADSLNLATITSSTTDRPLLVLAGAHDVTIAGMRITTTAPQSNQLVQIGGGETSAAQLPHHIVLRQLVIDPGANDVRRNVQADGAYLAIISSTLANCHSLLGDAQCVLAINAAGPLRIENNTLQFGHQCVMLGGGDPLIAGQVPSDVVIRRNDCTRPAAQLWSGQQLADGTHVYLTGQWPGKTGIELKLGKRVLVEGNVLCHVIADQQTGFAFLFKSVNQNGSAPWSETADVTVRYNRVCGVAGGFNLSPLPQPPGVPMARVSIYRNVLDSVSVGRYAGDNDALQNSGVNDVLFQENWIRNASGTAGGRSCLYFGGVSQRFTATSNVCGGEYGIKKDGGVVGDANPGGLVSGNTVLPWGTACTSWPAAPRDSTRDALLSGVVVP